MKNIHIGSLIKKRVNELDIDTSRIIAFFKTYTEEEIKAQFKSKSILTDDLLKWSKLLEYDFFRIYSQHIILFSPLPKNSSKTTSSTSSVLPSFRKSVYTKEIIDFVLDLYTTENKKIQEISNEYNIPKNTIHNWIKKYLPQN
ncbi:transposase [Empedobacter stercoris]|uniref:transposase n=2 Tax=Weeksellaceae TaxID=2762318 RepID=UPI001CE03511|nr:MULTISPECIES: transposase [Empedobacter]MCA4775781.1 transposase [Empedobacter stercoris]MDM1524154.1 transposase [Empedobacter sp. 225-1]MDM1543206.1 transposase [Empedobacter sp. 189-2]UWX68160.1 transposase [Empedobacter stercoris]